MIGAIMTGGKSRRMGFNKAFIETGGTGGETILSRTVSIFKALFDETVIVAAEDTAYKDAGVAVLTDIYPNCGSMGGIFTALKNFPASDIFIAACDMPHIEPAAVKAVISAAKREQAPFDAAIPYINSRFHPLHALYTQNSTDKIERMVLNSTLRVQDFIDSSKVLKLLESDFAGIDIRRSVTNVNRPEELKEAGLGK